MITNHLEIKSSVSKSVWNWFSLGLNNLVAIFKCSLGCFISFPPPRNENILYQRSKIWLKVPCCTADGTSVFWGIKLKDIPSHMKHSSLMMGPGTPRIPSHSFFFINQGLFNQLEWIENINVFMNLLAFFSKVGIRTLLVHYSGSEIIFSSL